MAGNAAVLVNPYEESEITEAIVALISKPQFRRELSAGGIARAKAFSWNETARSIEDAYRFALHL